MADSARQLVQTVPDAHLSVFANRLAAWLIADLNRSEDDVPAFTASRAKALLRAAGVIDDPTLHDFSRLEENDTAVRIALFDLLDSCELAGNDEARALAVASGAAEDTAVSIEWLPLTLAAHAWKSGYPLYQLDPASPPGEYSPAGQLVRRAANFIRRQVQRSATERDKLGRRLAYQPGTTVTGQVPTLDELQQQSEVAPVPPHYRTPIPVNYPEVARETLEVEAEEAAQEPPAVTRNPPITITDDDIERDEQRPVTMPPIQITSDQLPSSSTASRQVRTPSSSSGSGSNLGAAVRQRFGSGKEPMQPVKLRIVVQEYQDGPGLYGLQVRVGCKGIKAHVAGTTNRDGIFLCELPVRVRFGLTYDVDVTWPRDYGGDDERKSITLNVDRTEFTLPFYRRLAK